MPGQIHHEAGIRSNGAPPRGNDFRGCEAVGCRERVRSDRFHFCFRTDAGARDLNSGSERVLLIRIDGFDEYLLSIRRAAYGDVQVRHALALTAGVESRAVRACSQLLRTEAPVIEFVDEVDRSHKYAVTARLHYSSGPAIHHV